jgi:hypothetical protein
MGGWDILAIAMNRPQLVHSDGRRSGGVERLEAPMFYGDLSCEPSRHNWPQLFSPYVRLSEMAQIVRCLLDETPHRSASRCSNDSHSAQDAKPKRSRRGDRTNEIVNTHSGQLHIRMPIFEDGGVAPILAGSALRRRLRLRHPARR